MLSYEQISGIRKAVAFGDSITYGMAASCPKKSWASLTISMIEDSFDTKIQLINQGICANILSPGSPARSFIKKPSGLERLDRDVIEENPDLLLIAFGLNDSRGGTELDMFRADYQKMIDRIRGKISPVIVVLDLFYMHESFYRSCIPWNHSDYDLSRKFCDCIRELANKNGLIYADIFSMQYGLDCTVCPDHCHPNDLGHRLIANKVFESLICGMK